MTRIFFFTILLVSVNAGSQSLSPVLIVENSVRSVPAVTLVAPEPVRKEICQSELMIDTIVKLQLQMQRELRNRMFMADQPISN